MQQVNGLPQSIRVFMQDKEKAMLALLQELVLIQSDSANKAGLERMADAIAGIMPPVMQLQRFCFPEHGDMIMAKTPNAAAGEKQLLLLGHTDTVFPPESDFNFYREDESRSYGPGVIDMKGGLICGIYALLALDHFGLLEQIPVCMFCNSDEEIGSPASWDIICMEADKSFAAFVMECGGSQNEIVTGRKGKSGYKLIISGQSGHAAQAGSDKPSAILELAHKIIELEALNDPPRISLNVGTVKGGIGPNTVPGQAEALIDIRYLQKKDDEQLKAEIDRILKIPVVRGTSCRRTYQSGRPSMPQSASNEKLFQLVQSQAELLGQSILPEFRSGVSDANVVASRGVMVLDGMGPLGDFDHSEREYMLKSSLVERAGLLALSIWHCCRRKQAFGFEKKR
jgi:glutamate carboxypeptidase